ncbi:TetR/AcrR family transcriptional regulator [Mycobacterium genavense]|uniref:TetR/AcrR family transcriptional regulator n=1 Tax=Mycobacterium genavense TaxID=36812 RepID=UPI00146FAD44|nr:TetR/AcrR family transcriptional regulator [Mycobacterium genavense]
MRYPPDQKARARDALVRAGTRSLKTSGFNGVGVDGLAAAAGVTSGAFYSNFPNKTAILQAVIDAGLGEPFVTDTAAMTRAEARAHLSAFLAEYMNTDHSHDVTGGCVMPALSADVSRAEPPVKEAYERKMTALIDRITELLDGAESDRRQRALSIVALMVGSVLISRGMPEQSETRSAALNSALATASALMDAGASPKSRRPR